jgi:phytoene dehydrogenase-like protein
MTNRYDTAIIGGGLAGLAAACVLAGAGRSVAVIESGSLGGRARSSERDGFTLNEGPHALYRAGHATRVLRSLGIEPEGGDPPLERSMAWTGGTAYPLPVTPLALLRSKMLGARGKLAAARIASALQSGHDGAAPGLALSEWLDHKRVTTNVRAMVETYVRLSTYTNAPDTVSAEAAIRQLALAGHGVWYLHRGWQQLVDGLVDVAICRGVALRTGTPVTALTTDGRDHALETGGRGGDIVAGNVLIAGLSPGAATRIVGVDPGWSEAAGPASDVACLDVGLTAQPTVPIMLSMDEPLYGSVHSPPARLAPEGAALLGVMRYLRPDEELDRDEARRSLWLHAERMGAERSEATWERFLRRMTASHGMPRARTNRPTGAELADRGIWVAGDWVGGPVDTGAQLADAAVASAESAARAILRRRVRVA